MELQALQQECLACRRCGLCETRHSVVFGQGAAHAEVMLVGEGPGANEDEQGLPFVGKSGQLLDHYLEAVDLSRDKNVYPMKFHLSIMTSSMNTRRKPRSR